MAKIDSAYAYYASTYANKEVSRYDSHKKSDLRKIYNRIIKTNKESPLYKISNMSEAKKYAIDIKESSKAILNAVDSLSDKYAGSSDSFQKKVAESSNEDAVGVRYVGDGSENKGADGFDIDVRQLAAPQINTGSYLDSKALSFIPGSYSFDINTKASSYEFQFGVKPVAHQVAGAARLCGADRPCGLSVCRTLRPAPVSEQKGRDIPSQRISLHRGRARHPQERRETVRLCQSAQPRGTD